MIPQPGCGIDGLAHRAQQAQGREIVGVGNLVALADERTNGRRRSIKSVHTIFFDDAPKSSLTRPIGRALVHQGGRAGRQRAIDNVRMSCHPADIGRAPVNVFVFDIEDPVHGGEHLRHISAAGVHHALGLAGGAGGVEDI